jgi:3-mercaptopyruvate sulfurtransferase SseA
MSEKIMKKSRGLIAALLGTVMIAALTIWGCGTSSYDAPVTGPVATKTATALIDADTLSGWVDAGLVNSKSGEKVVILVITGAKDNYERGHIPGAIYVDPAELVQTRIEGVAASNTMVPDGSKMDALIQRCGIDKNTTIVFTASTLDPIYYMTRAYTTFRYWGFPKERLKVLDGWDNGWKDAYAMTSVVPTVTRSSYCVTPDGVSRVQTAIRASLSDMIATVTNYDAVKHAIIDTRSTSTSGAYLGTAPATTGVFSPNAGSVAADYVVFEGHMKNAQAVVSTSIYDTTNLNRFFPADDSATGLKTKFAAVGMDASKTAYVYCRTGYIASVEFFALDGILGWNAVWYDGSWSQWGQMSTDTANGGKLPATTAAAWRTDVAALSEPFPIFYNFGKSATISGVVTTLTLNHIEALPVDPFSASLFTTTTDLGANQIENEDAAYKSPVIPTSGSGSLVAGGGGC